MHHFFVSPEQIGEYSVRIVGQDVNHIRQVLRMHTGDELVVRTGQDMKEYRCAIAQMDEQCIEAQILWTEELDTELPCRITLFQCLPKSDKMEWIIQKVVELGAFRIVPVASRRSIVKLSGGKAEAKVRRWNAVAESAAKQSRRSFVPEVGAVVDFAGALREAEDLDVLLIPYELAQDMNHTREILSGIRPGASIGIIIGPEGGLEAEEVASAQAVGAHSITLGRRILRTETAGMALIAALMIALEDSSITEETEQ